MKLHEYQAKELLKKAGIAVPQGAVADNAAAGLALAQDLGLPLAIKAQVYVGGRGKAGAIRIASSPEELKKGLAEILGMKVKGFCVKKVLIEKALKIKEQFYAGVTVDRSKQSNVVMVSDAGGIDIEETARARPGKVMTAVLKSPQALEEQTLQEMASFLRLPAALRPSCAQILRTLFSVYVNNDAHLAEINPLVLTEDNRLVACDAKMVIDDNALFRHQEIKNLREETEDNELEKEAHRRNLAYVKLSGNIGIVGNGAGLVMATMDEVQRAGGKPANFLDIGGGAKREVVQDALEVLVLDKDVRGIFINIFGGITRCDEVAEGVLQVIKAKSVSVPVVLRLAGTRCEEARRLLGNGHLIAAENMEEGAERIVALVNR